MRVKGFTLVELLAILVIIGIIAVITTPVINGVISTSREKAFLNSAISINKAANNYYAENGTSLTVIYGDNESNIKYLKYSGDKPDSGSIYIDNSGNVSMAIYNAKVKKCAYKDVNDKEPILKDITKEECKLN